MKFTHMWQECVMKTQSPAGRFSALKLTLCLGLSFFAFGLVALVMATFIGIDSRLFTYTFLVGALGIYIERTWTENKICLAIRLLIWFLLGLFSVSCAIPLGVTFLSAHLYNPPAALVSTADSGFYVLEFCLLVFFIYVSKKFETVAA